MESIDLLYGIELPGFVTQIKNRPLSLFFSLSLSLSFSLYHWLIFLPLHPVSVTCTGRYYHFRTKQFIIFEIKYNFATKQIKNLRGMTRDVSVFLNSFLKKKTWPLVFFFEKLF